MTVAEARREINRANAKIFRLIKGQFKGETPATQALDQRLERLGMKRTKKGYISTKGLTSKAEAQAPQVDEKSANNTKSKK